MIDLLMAVLITQLRAKTSPALPQLTVMEKIWLAVLIAGLLAGFILAVAW